MWKILLTIHVYSSNFMHMNAHRGLQTENMQEMDYENMPDELNEAKFDEDESFQENTTLHRKKSEVESVDDFKHRQVFGGWPEAAAVVQYNLHDNDSPTQQVLRRENNFKPTLIDVINQKMSSDKNKNDVSQLSDSDKNRFRSLETPFSERSSNVPKDVNPNQWDQLPTTFILKGTRSFLSPKLLSALASCGWKDEIAIVDSDFSVGGNLYKASEVIELSGIPIEPLVVEILKFWKLDNEMPLALMLMDNNEDVSQKLKLALSRVIQAEEACGSSTTTEKADILTRKEFLSRINNTRYIVKTGEVGPWNNIILRKGLIRDNCLRTCTEDADIKYNLFKQAENQNTTEPYQGMEQQQGFEQQKGVKSTHGDKFQERMEHIQGDKNQERMEHIQRDKNLERMEHIQGDKYQERMEHTGDKHQERMGHKNKVDQQRQVHTQGAEHQHEKEQGKELQEVKNKKMEMLQNSEKPQEHLPDIKNDETDNRISDHPKHHELVKELQELPVSKPIYENLKNPSVKIGMHDMQYQVKKTINPNTQSINSDRGNEKETDYGQLMNALQQIEPQNYTKLDDPSEKGNKEIDRKLEDPKDKLHDYELVKELQDLPVSTQQNEKPSDPEKNWKNHIQYKVKKTIYPKLKSTNFNRDTGNEKKETEIPDGFRKSVDVELNGTFPSRGSGPPGEIIMDLETLTKDITANSNATTDQSQLKVGEMQMKDNIPMDSKKALKDNLPMDNMQWKDNTNLESYNQLRDKMPMDSNMQLKENITKDSKTQLKDIKLSENMQSKENFTLENKTRLKDIKPTENMHDDRPMDSNMQFRDNVHTGSHMEFRDNILTHSNMQSKDNFTMDMKTQIKDNMHIDNKFNLEDDEPKENKIQLKDEPKGSKLHLNDKQKDNKIQSRENMPLDENQVKDILPTEGKFQSKDNMQINSDFQLKKNLPFESTIRLKDNRTMDTNITKSDDSKTNNENQRLNDFKEKADIKLRQEKVDHGQEHDGKKEPLLSQTGQPLIPPLLPLPPVPFLPPMVDENPESAGEALILNEVTQRQPVSGGLVAPK